MTCRLSRSSTGSGTRVSRIQGRSMRYTGDQADRRNRQDTNDTTTHRSTQINTEHMFCRAHTYSVSGWPWSLPPDQLVYSLRQLLLRACCLHIENKSLPQSYAWTVMYFYKRLSSMKPCAVILSILPAFSLAARKSQTLDTLRMVMKTTPFVP